MAEVIFDTNVPVVANGLAGQASPACVEACIDRLVKSQNEDVVLVDDIGLIFEEYQRYLAHHGQPGPGDAFFKWLWDNQANEAHCRRVPITSIHPDPRAFLEFPDDPRLAAFDASDRKFVAVAIAANTQPIIVNASDTDWWPARYVLAEHGVTVEFVCPEFWKRLDLSQPWSSVSRGPAPQLQVPLVARPRNQLSNCRLTNGRQSVEAHGAPRRPV